MNVWKTIFSHLLFLYSHKTKVNKNFTPPTWREKGKVFFFHVLYVYTEKLEGIGNFFVSLPYHLLFESYVLSDNVNEQ